jgi:hypothetical protein
MIKDYPRCVYLESKGNPARALRISGELLLTRLRHRMGPRDYSLFRFADMPKANWHSYVNDNELYARFIEHKIPEDLRQLLSYKLLFHQHCIENDLSTPSVICMVGQPGHQVSDTTITRIDNIEQWKNVLESAPPELFVKPVVGANGAGAFAIRRVGSHFFFGESEDNEHKGSAEDLYRYTRHRANVGEALMVQPRYRSHPNLLEFSSASGLATARVVTVMAGNEAQVLYACARLSVGANITDNLAKGLSGNLNAAIGIDTGVLARAWGSALRDWPLMQPVAAHPDTGRQIQGSAFPLWPEVIRLALRAQESVPGLKTVGWDIAVTDTDEAMLIEGNPHYGVDLLQIAYERGLRHELTALMEGQAVESSTSTAIRSG